jgi:hypothetical protein
MSSTSSSSFSDWFDKAKNQTTIVEVQQSTTTTNSTSSSNGGDKFISFLTSWGIAIPAGNGNNSGGHESDIEQQELLVQETTTTTTTNGGISDQLTLSRSERFKWFIAFLILSLMFFISSLLFFPMAILMPGKFAFSFTMGSLSFMGAFALIQGPAIYCRECFRMERLPFTIAYVGSILGTLYSTVIWHSYIGVVIFASCQICTLAWYGSNNIPGGRTGLMVITTTIKTTCMGCFKACRAIVGFAM